MHPRRVQRFWYVSRLVHHLAAELFMKAVLHHSVSALIVSTDSIPPVPTGLPLVILRSGQGIVHLLQSNLNSPDSRVTSRLPDIAKRFTMIFLLLQDAGCTIETERTCICSNRGSNLLTIHAVFVCILEALAMLDPDILRSSFKCLQEDAKFQLNGRVDKGPIYILVS
jgi:hypothetical protein